MQSSDVAVLLVYWALVLIWVFAAALGTFFLLNPRHVRYPWRARVSWILTILAARYALEISYWAIAATARIGYMNSSVSDSLYDN